MDHGVSFRQKQRQSRTNTASIKAKHKLQYLLHQSINNNPNNKDSKRNTQTQSYNRDRCFFRPQAAFFPLITSTAISCFLRLRSAPTRADHIIETWLLMMI
jgi:hypothetical protein